MRRLATIPDLGTAGTPALEPVCPPAVGVTDPGRAGSADEAEPAATPRPARTIRITPKAAFPWASIAALVAFAVAAWSLASWNDARRLARQQAEQRLADRPSATSVEAVLR
ncbi:MAG: hypothetical protein RLZZ440_2319 [Planctomycetota bacterium]